MRHAEWRSSAKLQFWHSLIAECLARALQLLSNVILAIPERESKTALPFCDMTSLDITEIYSLSFQVHQGETLS